MSSEWVKTEIAKARKREVKEGKRVLFPVRLVGFESAARLGVLRRRYRERFGARDTRVLHPRLQQLEGPRFVSDGVSAAGKGFESRSGLGQSWWFQTKSFWKAGRGPRSKLKNQGLRGRFRDGFWNGVLQCRS